MHSLLIFLGILVGAILAIAIVCNVLGWLINCVPPKAFGLCMVIVGGVMCTTFFGMVIGIPLILLGGCILFAG